MDLFDTHCHVHEAIKRTTPVYDRWHKNGQVDPEAIVIDAKKAGVTRLICVGTTVADSQLALEFAGPKEGVWAAVGVHPHEAEDFLKQKNQQALEELISTNSKSSKLVAIGEVGLDYYYAHSDKKSQQQLLKIQLDLAVRNNLPIIFHVREAFDDFWQILDQYPGVKGVVHSFSSNTKDLDAILSHGLYIGLNGIITFTKVEEQLRAAKQIPLDRLVLETDAPFLTPAPNRGKICEPKHVRDTAEFLAKLRGETLEELAAATTANANKLFNL